MFSYILLFLSVIPLLSRGFNLALGNKIYSVIITSALFSYSILGLISLILINLDNSRFPILSFSIFIFLFALYFNNNSYRDYALIKNFLLGEIIKFKNTFIISTQRKSIILICFLLLLISISSIGPINHPDALDYHIGYPYQYWLKGKFFIDEGLHQALMGAGDYAHLAFIQEKTIWLIRYIQISTLPLITLFLINNIKSKVYIIALLSSSTFIQWSTIGKPLFLGESACAIAYIIWEEYKDNLSRKLLLICIISCISIKISSLIVCTPIAIHLILDIFFDKKTNNVNKRIDLLKNILFDKSILLSLSLLLAILFSRYKIIGNFAFPLLTNIFNKNDILITNFTEFLSGYQRDGMFPINIFLPTSVSDIASALGPGVLLILILLTIKTIKKINLKENILFYICLSQILLLLIFCQGRADYYALPIIISIYFSDNISMFLKNKFIKSLFYLSIYFQLILITGFLFFSINQNFLSISNYEKAMISNAYGFDLSKLINPKTSGNFYQNVIRDTRFFYPKNYISREQVQKCIQNNNSQDFCVRKYNISQIISGPKFLLDKQNYKCNIKTFISGTRNPLNRRAREVEVCEKIDLSK